MSNGNKGSGNQDPEVLYSASFTAVHAGTVTEALAPNGTVPKSSQELRCIHLKKLRDSSAPRNRPFPSPQ